MSDDPLYRALTSMTGWQERWTERRQSGLSDDQLKSAIGFEFGIGGGSFGPGSIAEEHSGGTSPKFWLGEDAYSKKRPTLEGQRLIDAVRTLLGIPMPGGMIQRTLF